VNGINDQLRIDLSTAQVTGFFRLPAPSLAEHNPTVYQLAMASAPAGAGTCALCGMGILNNVIVTLASGETVILGMDCAEKVGGEVGRCISAGLTSKKVAEMDARRAQLAAESARLEREREECIRARRVKFADTLTLLRLQNSQFFNSLADQLEIGPLSDRQASFVLKLVFGRYSKRVADEYNKLADRLVGYSE
jgi:hypothetical protein